jgi:superfamily II DNA/RNA helicase
LASTTLAGEQVQQLPALRSASDVAGLAEALAHLPPPLPLADGAQATAIVRLTLAFAWASSLAALDVALKRRIERGCTLDDQLAAGHWPSRDALRAWILGDDATQLAFGFDLAARIEIPTGTRATLGAHLNAVRALRTLIKPQVERDTAQRARSLKMLLNDVAPRRAVVLAQSAVTVRALYAALRAEPGVVAITGNRVRAAAGRWTRDEVLRALGPGADVFDARDLRGIRLLIATDILAEGVELQGASVLVHADPTWTPARLEQRVGRVAREGQREQVLVTQFAIPPTAEALLRMRDRLQRKSVARVTALRVANKEVELRSSLHHWLRLGPAAEHSPRVAAVRAAQCGFVALIRNGEAFQLVAGEHREGRWRVRESPSALLRALPEALPATTPEPAPMTITQLRTVRRVLQRWHHERQARSVIADETALPDEIIRALRHRLEGEIAQASLSQRSRTAGKVGELLAGISALRGRGVELTLKRSLRESTTGAELAERLRALSSNRGAVTHQRPAPLSGTGCLRLAALLLLVPEPGQRNRSGAAFP